LTNCSGFFVVAPDLLGHAGRQSSDYSVSALAKDLRPFFTMDESYDVIIGHSFGGVVVLSLLPFLPKGKETTVILVDPAIELSETRRARVKNTFMKEVASLRSPEEHMAEHPAWAQSDCMLRTLGLSRCDRTALESLIEVNIRAWILQALLTSSTLVMTSITRHGLSVTCSKTSLQTWRSTCCYQIPSSVLCVF
jgi:pimeloyl-ACP methyl ester carboxylesterase